jgi:DNA polymerase bacteriophage-type
VVVAVVQIQSEADVKLNLEINDDREYFDDPVSQLQRMTPECKRVLQIRQMTSRTSTAKLDSLAEQVAPDGRLRYAYQYYGAARTGRWSGSGPQPHNFPRKPVQIGNTEVDLRAAFRAPKGNKLVVCDLSAIENRVLGWVSGCFAILDVFAWGLDPYKDFATKLYRVEYDDVTPAQRQMSKPAVLGCGYGLGGGEDKVDKNGDDYKSGLWGYAANMGVQMTQQEAIDAVRTFRQSYPEVPEFWRAIENAVISAVVNPNTAVKCGKVVVGCNGERLVIVLPNKRRLHYLSPKIQQGFWPPREVVELFEGVQNAPNLQPKMEITYEGLNGITKQWQREKTYGGKLTENIVQAIARDVLAEGMLRADKAGFEIVGTTHDEIIALADVGGSLHLSDLRRCMVEPPEWAVGLPLDADGYETTEAYRK